MCLIRNNGLSPSIRLISKEIRLASDKEKELLSVDSNERLLSLKRLFYGNDIPVILTHNVFPLPLLKKTTDEVNGSLHIRDLLQYYFEQEIAFVITDIHATLAGQEVGSLLNISPSNAMLALDVSFYNKDSILLSLGTNYFNDKVLSLSLIQAWTNSSTSL